MQYDGNLVIYQPGCAAPAIWQSGTGGHATQAFFLKAQGDGNLVIYYASGAPLWSSGTNTSDTIAFEGGDCWSVAVRECSGPNAGEKDAFAYFEGIDQTGQSSWATALKAAAHAWDSYSPSPVFYNYCTGPRTGCVYTPNTSDMYVYLKTSLSTATLYGLQFTPGTQAVTFYCSNSYSPYQCKSNFEAAVPQWSEIYFFSDVINQYYTANYLQNIAAHEMGHSVGLAHNWAVASRNQSVMYPFQSNSCGNSCGSGGPTATSRQVVYE